jgi:cytochrome c oxidase assembly protein subunit 15
MWSSMAGRESQLVARPTTMRARPRNWTHLLACLLVAVTAVLLCFGALVTTYEAAMAVPDWPATYGHNMFLFPLAEWLGGPWDLFLEHGHRLLGAVVGMLSLLLAAVVWRSGQTPAVRALAVAAVVLVVAQGVLGGARVLLDDKTIAKVHACTGPLFFAVATAIAALTRRGPQASGAAGLDAGLRPPQTRGVAATVGAAALVVAAYVQLVAGAQLRHLDAGVDPLTFRWLVGFHIAGAVVVALLAGMLAWVNGGAASAARRWSWLIAGLVVCQILLGCGAWVVSWGLPSGLLPDSWRLGEAIRARSPGAAAVVTGHVVLGMLILGGSVVLWIVGGGLRDSARGRAGGLRTTGRAGVFA